MTGNKEANMTVLDQSLVNELREVMGEDFTTLVDSFERDGLHRLEGIREALSNGDHENLRALSHSFKGSSSNVGAMAVADTCQAIEGLARDGNLTEAGELVSGLEERFRDALEALRH